jgi:hypothetical protein
LAIAPGFESARSRGLSHAAAAGRLSNPATNERSWDKTSLNKTEETVLQEPEKKETQRYFKAPVFAVAPMIERGGGSDRFKAKTSLLFSVRDATGLRFLSVVTTSCGR